MSDLLEADSIRKEFGRKQVLTDISLRCQPGDIIGLLGRNGSGKSTLLKILFGTLYTDYKFIRINDTIMGQPFKTKHTIAYLNQDNFLPKNITVKQVFEIYSGELDAKGFIEDEVLSKVLQTKIRNLSGGESRYLEVKLLLCLNTLFVLLDEPFNGLDPTSQIFLKRILVDYKNQNNAAILISSHDLNHITEICTRIVLLEKGSVIRDMKNSETLLSELESYFSVEKTFQESLINN